MLDPQPWDGLILFLDKLNESLSDEAFEAAVARGEAEQASYESALAVLKARQASASGPPPSRATP